MEKAKDMETKQGKESGELKITPNLKQRRLNLMWRYRQMLARCYNRRNIRYATYGGRGIIVCTRWRDKETGFQSFLADMGYPPSGHSLDRIDSNGEYSPENCRWADAKTQSRNFSRTVRYLVGGKRASISELAEESGIPMRVLYLRIRRGNWDVEKAISTPVREWRRQATG